MFDFKPQFQCFELTFYKYKIDLNVDQKVVIFKQN